MLTQEVLNQFHNNMRQHLPLLLGSQRGQILSASLIGQPSPSTSQHGFIDAPTFWSWALWGQWLTWQLPHGTKRWPNSNNAYGPELINNSGKQSQLDCTLNYRHHRWWEKLPGQNRFLALNSISPLGLDKKEERDPGTIGIHRGTDGVVDPFHFLHESWQWSAPSPSYFVAAVQLNNSNLLGTHIEDVILCVCLNLFLSPRPSQDSDEALDTHTFRVWPMNSHGVHSCLSKGPLQQVRPSNRTRP